MSFEIRNAQKTDVQAIHDLITELAVFEKEPNAVEISSETLVNDGFGENPKFRCFVAEKDQKIIGMALFYERYSTWKGKAIHLEDLIVTQSERGTGVGKALYTKVLAFAHQNGYKRVAWEVLDWNIDAIDFYKDTGAHVFDEWRVVHMNEQRLEQYINENI